MPRKKAAEETRISLLKRRSVWSLTQEEQMEVFMAESFDTESFDTQAKSLEVNKPRIEKMRWTTLGLRHNLTQIRWAWEHPGKSYDHVSVPMQQIMTLLALVSLFPLEEMLHDLRDDEWSARRIPAWIAAELSLDIAGGFMAQLPNWRHAVALGQVEVYLESRGRHIAGLRAWLPPHEDEPGWQAEMEIARLSSLVKCLLEILPAWGEPPLQVKLPPRQTIQ